jgi:hypothetical protein
MTAPDAGPSSAGRACFRTPAVEVCLMAKTGARAALKATPGAPLRLNVPHENRVYRECIAGCGATRRVPRAKGRFKTHKAAASTATASGSLQTALSKAPRPRACAVWSGIVRRGASDKDLTFYDRVDLPDREYHSIAVALYGTGLRIRWCQRRRRTVITRHQKTEISRGQIGVQADVDLIHPHHTWRHTRI